MYYRYDADDLMYEVIGDKGEIVCKTNTEKEAQKIIKTIDK